MDVKLNSDGEYIVYVSGGNLSTGIHPVQYSKKMADLGAGELFVNSIDRDGLRSGYDINLIRQVSDSVDVPVIACGGAGTYDHLRQALHEGHSSAVSAGSMFVFSGRKRAVLINYPSAADKESYII